MSDHWLLIIVDPAEPTSAQFHGTVIRQPMPVSHLRHAAWLLDRAARTTIHTTGRSHHEGISWTDEHSVCVIEWQGDIETVRFHGRPMSQFSLVSSAEQLRWFGAMPNLVANVQATVMQTLQAFDQAKAEAKVVQEVASQNGGAMGGKVIILGR